MASNTKVTYNATDVTEYFDINKLRAELDWVDTGHIDFTFIKLNPDGSWRVQYRNGKLFDITFKEVTQDAQE